MTIRTMAMAAGIIVCIGIAVFNWSGRNDGGGEPLKSAGELSGLPDDKLELAVLMELGREAYSDGSPADAWRSMNRHAQHLWSVASLRNIDASRGLPEWLAAVSCDGATSPSPEEIRDGLAEMGLNETRVVMDEIIAQRASDDLVALSKLRQRLVQSITGASAVATRQAWVREHVHDLIKR